MTDTTQGQTGEPRAERKNVSKREFLAKDATGTLAPVDKIEQATAARYAMLIPGDTRNIDFDFSADSPFKTMCAIFGFHTKAGNVASTVLNNKDEPGTFLDAYDAVMEWIAAANDATDPVWAERAGGAGPRTNIEALADAICDVGAAAGKMPPRDKVLAKLQSDKQYVSDSRKVPEIAKAYAARVGRQTKSLDEILSF